MDSRMTRKTRQLYLASILIISFLTLPTILLYSSGYRIDWKTFSIQPAGALVISSIPKDAILQVAEKHIVDATPSIIGQLSPGEYRVSISKDGYTTWQDVVSIFARRSTIIGTVLIFKVNPENTTIDSYPDSLYPLSSAEDIQDFSPDIQFALSRLDLSEQYKIVSDDVPMFTILDIEKHTLYLVDTRSSEIEIQKISDTVTDFEWNIEANQLLFYSDHEISIYNFDNKETRSIIRQSGKISEAFWHPRANYILFVTGDQVRAIESRLTDAPNITTVYHGNEPHDVYINKKGTTLYLTESDETIIESVIQ